MAKSLSFTVWLAEERCLESQSDLLLATEVVDPKNRTRAAVQRGGAHQNHRHLCELCTRIAAVCIVLA